MFPYTDKENAWLSRPNKPSREKIRKSNRNRQRRVVEAHPMDKRGPYWFVPYNRFKI